MLTFLQKCVQLLGVGCAAELVMSNLSVLYVFILLYGGNFDFSAQAQLQVFSDNHLPYILYPLMV